MQWIQTFWIILALKLTSLYNKFWTRPSLNFTQEGVNLVHIVQFFCFSISHINNSWQCCLCSSRFLVTFWRMRTTIIIFCLHYVISSSTLSCTQYQLRFLFERFSTIIVGELQWANFNASEAHRRAWIHRPFRQSCSMWNIHRADVLCSSIYNILILHNCRKNWKAI